MAPRDEFHGITDRPVAPPGYGLRFTYTFENFFHPFVGDLIEKLNTVPDLASFFDPSFLAGREHEFFSELYGDPPDSRQVEVESSPKTFDVEVGGPYANYNWELFFHIPLTIAVHLSKNQRFAEAQRWFHFIFDPTAYGPSGEEPERFWRFIAFRKDGAGRQIGERLALLSKPDSDLDDDERELKKHTLDGYRAILDHPFQPHRVARTRYLAYMYSVVMKYLDNLIAWGDHLYRQDTRESINEAMQQYVLAANILGNRPEEVPVMGAVQPKTFAQLKRLDLDRDRMGNPLVELEGAFPLNLGTPSGTEGADAAAPLFGLGRTFYFCVPRNDNLLGYWDTVADRLFKIRHCMNIEGTVRPLALFDPPIDPGMLVKAAAAGIDIGAVVAGLHQPASPVRAQLLIQKALELAAEVRRLGSALLQTLEKQDAERLALLRQGHEVKIQQLQQEVRFLQWKQAQEATESLLRSRAAVRERYTYYLRLLGQEPDEKLAPETVALDRRELTEENFDETYAALVGQYDVEVPVHAYPRLSLEGGGSPTHESGAKGPGRFTLITSESDEIDRLETARDYGLAASIADATATATVFMPDIHFDFHYWGIGGTTKLPVGTAITKTVEVLAKVLQTKAAWERDQAGIASRTAGHERRADDWLFQANAAARELRHIGRQMIASLIAEQVAHRDYQAVQQQIEHSQEVDTLLREKFTNAELYAWMQGEQSRLYYEYYRFAFDTARRAEQTMKRELMRPELDDKSLVRFNYWDAGRKGLLSGEALYLDCKRLEMAYHEHNLREYELTKHASLLQLDPLALVKLRATGRCTVRLPESLFDLDGPGHYFRRIKTVALSIPCVTGPYTSVNCKLTLLKSSIRTSPEPGGSYERGAEDTRFQDYFGSVQSVVTSSGQQDSGLFETNLRDERHLPFENAGAISEWRLELPADPSNGDPAQFDYHTISDVILHLRYTGRDASASLRRPALDHVRRLIGDGDASGSVRLFAVRLEFPAEWARFTSQTPDAGQRRELALTLRPEHYPFWSQGRLGSVARIDLVAEPTGDTTTIAVADRADLSDPATVQDDLVADDDLGGMLAGELANLAGVPVLAAPTGDLKLYFENELTDLWIAVTWSA